MCLARDQAKIVLNYARAYFTDIPLLQGMVERETAFGFELNNKIDIAVSTNSFRAVRGRPVLCAILDEIAARLAPGDPKSARGKAIGLFTMMVGTLQLSRALSDQRSADEVLERGIENALTFMR